MPLQPEPIRFTWPPLTGREIERKDLAFLASLVKNREWRRGWEWILGLSYFNDCHTFPCTDIKETNN